MNEAVFTVTLNPGLDRTLTVPEIRYNEVLRARDSRLDWGGKGFNVSRALKALGVESVALGFVGGAVGSMLDEGLQSLGIATDFVTIEGETRTNTVIAQAGSDRYVKVNEAGPAVSDEALDTLSLRVQERAAAGSLWALCGSLPPGVPVDIYARLVDSIQDAGGRAFLDASGGALRQGCASRPFLVKPNAEEAYELTGLRVESVQDAVRAAGAFLEMGAQNVALSLGAQGLVLASVGGAVHARPPSVDARVVVGVGDALLAGLIYATRRGLGHAQTARWGVAAGTAAAQGEGVSVGSREAILAVYDRVDVSVPS